MQWERRTYLGHQAVGTISPPHRLNEAIRNDTLWESDTYDAGRFRLYRENRANPVLQNVYSLGTRRSTSFSGWFFEIWCFGVGALPWLSLLAGLCSVVGVYVGSLPWLSLFSGLCFVVGVYVGALPWLSLFARLCFVVGFVAAEPRPRSQRLPPNDLCNIVRYETLERLRRTRCRHSVR